MTLGLGWLRQGGDILRRETMVLDLEAELQNVTDMTGKIWLEGFAPCKKIDILQLCTIIESPDHDHMIPKWDMALPSLTPLPPSSFMVTPG